MRKTVSYQKLVCLVSTIVLLASLGCGSSARPDASAGDDAALRAHLKKVEVAEMEHNRQTMQTQQPIQSVEDQERSRR
jgi:hypothetical protein